MTPAPARTRRVTAGRIERRITVQQREITRLERRQEVLRLQLFDVHLMLLRRQRVLTQLVAARQAPAGQSVPIHVLGLDDLNWRKLAKAQHGFA